MPQTASLKIETDAEEISLISDSELLTRFVLRQEEVAFREIVNRHGPLVMGVCLRVLSHREDAEDAFQAAFIVLSKRAGRIRNRESLTAWLYGVAYRVSVDIARKRQRSERALPAEPMQIDDPFEKLEHEFDRQVVDEEIQRLPSRLRTPLILFYLSGKTSKEIAEELGESQGTIDGRIKRGRQQLRLRLTRRGVALAGLLSVVSVSATQATAAVSPSLIQTTVSAAIAGSAGTPMPDVISSETLRVAGKEVLRMSLMKPLATTLCVALIATVGAICAQAFDGPGGGGTDSSIDTRAAVATETGVIVAMANAGQSSESATQKNPFSEDAKGAKAAEDPKVPDQDRKLAEAKRRELQKDLQQLDQKLKRYAEALEELEESIVALRERAQFSEVATVNREIFSLRRSEQDTQRKRLELEAQLLTLDGKHVEADSKQEQADKIKQLLANTAFASSTEGQSLSSRMQSLLEKRKAATRIEATLASPIDVITGGDSLKSVLDFVTEVHGIQIVADREQLSGQHIESLEDVLVEENLQISGIRLDSALDLLLANLEEVSEPLDYIVKSEVLMITTRDAARDYVDTRVYHLNLTTEFDPEGIMDSIELVIPGSEAPEGADSRLIGKQLVVRHNRRGHNKLLDFFAQMGIDVSHSKPRPQK